MQHVAVPAGARRNPFGAAGSREEFSSEKGLDPLKVDSEIEAKRMTSSHSCRTSSAQSSSRDGNLGSRIEAELVPKAWAKVNPMGDAKPRELKLYEQGIDRRKLDLELEFNDDGGEDCDPAPVLPPPLFRLCRRRYGSEPSRHDHPDIRSNHNHGLSTTQYSFIGSSAAVSLAAMNWSPSEWFFARFLKEGGR